MAFNHYAKIKRILSDDHGWVIKVINKPTSAKKFNGEVVKYSYYYRVYDAADKPIKYCKFQQIDRFAQTMGIEVKDLPIITS